MHVNKTNMAAGNLYIKFYIQGLILFAVLITALHSSKMKITGKITVSGLQEGVSLAEESFLTVKLEDTSVMDGSAVLLGKDEHMVPARTKLGPRAEGLNYTIVFEKPESLGPMYSVSAVLNVGRKANEQEWIRHGDYHTDTIHVVDLTQDPVAADITMVHYP